jgi:hypothetical protein
VLDHAPLRQLEDAVVARQSSAILGRPEASTPMLDSDSPPGISSLKVWTIFCEMSFSDTI